MPNNKWTKTATSASLAILGVTQLNNKADAIIVKGGSNVTQSGVGTTTWTLDSVYNGTAILSVFSHNNGAGTYNYGLVKFAKLGALGLQSGDGVNQGDPFEYKQTLVRWQSGNGASQFGYFGFQDTQGCSVCAPIYGWAKWTMANNTVTLDEWYYNDSPGGPITVGDKGTPVPFDFNPLQGVALGVPIFLGLRQLKRRKLKANSIVSVKRKEKIHPLALLGMGAAGVIKWRAQKDKDAA